MEEKLTKKKKIIIISVILIAVIAVLGYFYNNSKNASEYANATKSSESNDYSELFNFLDNIVGVKGENLEIINEPTLGIKGKVFAPKEAILNGIDYFLKKTDNSKMKDLSLELEDNAINIYVNYKLIGGITTPIDLKINPTLDESGNLIIGIEDVKFIDLKVSDWIVNKVMNSFIEDWFPDDGKFKVDFNEGNVVVYKENFKGTSLKNLHVNASGLEVELTVDLKETLTNK